MPSKNSILFHLLSDTCAGHIKIDLFNQLKYEGQPFPTVETMINRYKKIVIWESSKLKKTTSWINHMYGLTRVNLCGQNGLKLVKIPNPNLI